MHVLRGRRELPGTRQQLLQAHLLDLLLGDPQPLDEVLDPLGQLLGTHLQRLGQLGDEQVLAGQEAVGVAARRAPRPGVRRSRWSSRRAA